MSSFQAVTTTVRVYPQAPVSLSLTSAVIPSPWSLLTLIARSSNENDNDEDESSPSISRSSSLLFGFLITFLALFIGFMACGYSSRRAMRFNQAAAAHHLGGTNHYRDFSKMKKPRIWEVWIAEVPGKEQWKNMMPLSASLAPTSTSTGPPPSLDVMAGSTTTPDRRDHTTRWDLLSAYFARSSRRQHNFASPPPSLPRRTTGGPLPSTTPSTTSRPAYDPNPPESFILPPTDFRLPPHPSLISVLEREWSRNRTANEERRRATVDTSGKRLETHARISVLIAMPRSNSTGNTESTSHVEKAQCQGPGPGTEGRHDSESQPWADYELGVAHVPLCPPGLISRPGNNNPRTQVQTGGG